VDFFAVIHDATGSAWINRDTSAWISSVDHAIFVAQHKVYIYIHARERNLVRWCGDTREWTPIGASTLDPQRNSAVGMASRAWFASDRSMTANVAPEQPRH
jgi:hypothetical protein